MLRRWSDEPFAILTPALAAGIALAPLLFPYWFAALALASGTLVGASMLALARRRHVACLCLVTTALIVDGLLLALAERDGFRMDDIRSLLARGTLPTGVQLMIDGCILEDGVDRGQDVTTTLDIRGFRIKDRWVPARGKVQLRVVRSDVPGAPSAELRYGDRIRAWAVCDVPRNFQNPGSPDRVGMLARRGIFLLAHVKSPRLVEILPDDFGGPFDVAVSSFRRSLRALFEKLAGESDRRRAAILASIVLGDYTGLSRETRIEFQNAGTFHVLVVSGLHVSTIAWIITRALKLVRVPAVVAAALAAAAVFTFTSIVGFQASLTRALWMFILYLIGQALFRRASPSNIVLACAFLLLGIHPCWLLDTGFQLSFLSVATIVTTGLPGIENALRPWLTPLRHAGDPGRLGVTAGRWHRMGRRLRFRAESFAEACADALHPAAGKFLLAAFRLAGAFSLLMGSMLLISLCVQAWLEPVLALHFNRLSWVAPAANLAIVPLSSLVLLAGMSAGGLACLFACAWPLFRLAGSSAALLADVNHWFASIPGAWQRCPTPPEILVIAGFLLAFCWCFFRRDRQWIPCAILWIEIAALSLAGLGLWPGFPHTVPAASGSVRESKPGPLRLSFLDVGQGDSIIIQFPDGRTWAVDAGGLWTDPARPDDQGNFDVGEAVVSRFLWSRWITVLDRTILTHPHRDHAGGIPALLENFPVGRLDCESGAIDSIQSRILEAARRNRVPVHAASAGEAWRVSGVDIRVLNPGHPSTSRSPNDESVVLHMKYGGFSALLAGDMEEQGENRVLERTPDLKSDLLKVAHHGSRGATRDRLLDRVRPRWAVISAGRGNPFQNPSTDTLLRLLRRRARLLLTMDQGAIFFETNGVRYTLSSYRLGILEQGYL